MTTRGNSKGPDELGQEVLWSSRGQQVMMQWEKQYMELCVDALAIQPTDRVLEIGFGLAYSASHIQRFRPRSHTIIECDWETLQRARQFAVNHSGAEIVAGTWQRQFPTLDQFDCVFFDDYPLPELEIVGPLGSDEAAGRQRSRWHDFLDSALNHCSTGARISGYLARKLDLQRPGCQVTLSTVQVDVPEHCNYFPHKTALVPVITVVDPIAAARSASAGINSLLSLPHSSKKFKRAFEFASSSEQGPHLAGFTRERQQISDIRDFLLAHELGALSYVQLDDIENSMEVNQPSNQSILRGEHIEKGEESIHYNDEKSRREFLHTLRNKAATSKST